MRATGIVRRVDDLGRVVIPKEIRRQMKIREGEPLEFFTENGYICLKKYGSDLAGEIESLREQAADYCDNNEVADLLRKAAELLRKSEGEE
jgi:AbrB family transcriptional regulator (stage V sporulation protein T)